MLGGVAYKITYLYSEKEKNMIRMLTDMIQYNFFVYISRVPTCVCRNAYQSREHVSFYPFCIACV